MQIWLEQTEFFEELPEKTVKMSWERLGEIAKALDKRGTGSSKIAFTKKFITRFNFSIERAATHPNCQSATYFLEKLKEITQLS